MAVTAASLRRAQEAAPAAGWNRGFLAYAEAVLEGQAGNIERANELAEEGHAVPAAVCSVVEPSGAPADSALRPWRPMGTAAVLAAGGDGGIRGERAQQARVGLPRTAAPGR